jgi:hypothetical protein
MKNRQSGFGATSAVHFMWLLIFGMSKQRSNLQTIG